MIRVSIRDNGVGIREEDLPHIFDRFFRSDSARSPATGGNGIGLSIVKKILEDHGGRVWAESREGKGCCMKLELKRWEEEDHE